MHPDTMITSLKSLRLHGMAQAVADLVAQSAPAYRQVESIVETTH